jgi:hypothetical protein
MHHVLGAATQLQAGFPCGSLRRRVLILDHRMLCCLDAHPIKECRQVCYWVAPLSQRTISCKLRVFVLLSVG